MSDLAEMLAANKPGAQWALSGTTLAGLTWLDGVQAAPTQTDLDAWMAGKPKRDLTAYAANKRWMVETGGIVVTGMNVPTDDRAKTLIIGAAASLTDTATVQFKSSGTWVALTGAQIRGLRDAITAHVQSCYAVEADTSAKISSGAITTTAQIDSAAWPSTGLGK